MIYTEMTDKDKLAFHNGNCTVKTKIIVSPGTNNEIILTEENSVQQWDYLEERYVPDVGFIGQFVARELNGKLNNISDDFVIENKTIELQFAVVRTENSETVETWYSLGLFKILEPEDDEVRDNTTFDAMDVTVQFNVDFNANYTNDTFTKSFADTIKDGGSFTALELAKYACAQAKVEFGNTTFTHSDFVISSNQFTEGNSCRDVMKAISQLAYGWCAIGWDNKCYIEELVVDTANIGETETITYDQYYSLTTQKIPYGPINKVVIGMEDVGGEGVSTDDKESIAQNGENELYIFDNPITYTDDLRNKAIVGAERLFGLSYTPVEMETIGHPWFKANKPIIVKNMENVVNYTYPFSLAISYTGHIKTTIKADSSSKAKKQLSYDHSIYKDLKNVKIEVDKQNGLITILNSNTKALEDGLGKLETKVETSITDTYSKTEIQEIVTGIGVDGVVVSSVKSTAGTFDKNGLTVEQTDANTKTNINADGMIIYNKQSSSDQALLTVNSNGVIAENIRVNTYLNVGEYSRLEDYTHTDGRVGTGVFWIGSD